MSNVAPQRVPARPPAAPPRPGAAAAPPRPNAPAAPAQPVAPAPVAQAPVSQPAPAQPVAPAPVTGEPVQTADPSQAAPTGTPGRKRRGGRRSQVAKSPYPGCYGWQEVNGEMHPVMIDDGVGGQMQQRVLLATVPTDFDGRTHDKLTESDFADKGTYWEFKAAEYTKLATEAANKARLIKAMGSVDDQKKANRLLKLQKEMAQLEAQLRASGANVDGLLNIPATVPVPSAQS